ncbi:polysaccharide biosynthesis protein [Aeromicrobium phragmitis]|uniref:Polysaccharide biosynthesis protein n=1 Tax=Aeromicrobium phragmitis TaxID=2478914 RepID=A0A3L8PJ63_9ACTN|nr:oligosaccharide flippase family protein [Aeromicrobium phragmitis]RLV55224.1 polysaccharide biosynthesis protein [Aeromicrobium phragmitis]
MQVRLRSATLVAAAMMVMNVVTYGFNLVAARMLIPAEFGAVTALLSIILVANVVSLGLQATIARKLSVAPAERRAAIIGAASRVTWGVSTAVGVVVACSTVIMTPALRLDSPVPVALCGAMIVPLTVMGAQAGVAQGCERWHKLSAIYLGNGFGRLIGGCAGILLFSDATGAMLGLAVGAWLPVIAGLGLLRIRGVHDDVRPLLTETAGSAFALLSYFVLSNADALIARNLFDPHDSGLYAAGLILTKATLFLPQFVSVVLFPTLSRDESHRSRLVAAAAVTLLGICVIGGTLALPQLALALVGGPQYAEIADRLWLFALSGSFLALAHMLVFDALARRAKGATALIWVALAFVVALAYALDVETTGLVLIVAGCSGTLCAVLLALPLVTERRSAPARTP